MKKSNLEIYILQLLLFLAAGLFVFGKLRKQDIKILELQTSQVSANSELRTLCLKLGGQIQTDPNATVKCQFSASSTVAEISSSDTVELKERIGVIERNLFFNKPERLPKGVVGYAVEGFDGQKVNCSSPWGLGICIEGKDIFCLMGEKSLLRETGDGRFKLYGCFYAPGVYKERIIDEFQIERTVPRSFMLSLARDLPNMFKDAECVAGSGGFKCSQLSLKNPIWRLGIRSQDTICGINNKPTNNPAEFIGALSSYQKMPDGVFHLCLIRNSIRKTVTFKFVESIQ